MQIKETMQRYGFTPTSLAKKMGVYTSTVTRLTEGNPTADKLDELARWIGCGRWEFFEDEIRAAGFDIVKVGQPVQTASEPAAGSALASSASQEGNGVELPFGQQKKDEKADGQQAKEVRAVRFSYQCPACGHQLQVCISEK